MIIAVASGKGGTGKTTVSASLAASWQSPVVAVDLGVEEPNLHLFLKPDIAGAREAFLDIPDVDKSKCSYCGLCADLCQFKAISVMGDILLTFPEMCHGCGGCMAICPENAIDYGQRKLGEISWGASGSIGFMMGRLRIGETMSPPLMRQVKAQLRRQYDLTTLDVIIDAPPGVSCPAVNAVSDTDAIVLVTEPTPFGAYDLKLAIEAFTPLNIPMGVIVNRAGIGNRDVYHVCKDARINILAEIPFDQDIAETYAKGEIIVRKRPDLQGIFSDVMYRLKEKKASWVA
jgi:MinD superfamily P-loop ATPase